MAGPIRRPLDHPSAREDPEAGGAVDAVDGGIAHRPSTDAVNLLETGSGRSGFKYREAV
jgi:hypothetical protein